jgi:uncharacterized protein (TIGR01777 family)
MMDLCISLLVVQACLGAFDTLYHHEFSVALPHQRTAQRELQIHAVRALLYAVVFVGLAWFEWGGVWGLVLIGIVLIEVVLTLWDFVIEDGSRLLPASERITHTLLAINGGAAFVLLAMTVPEWIARTTLMYPVDYGWRSLFLSVGAVGVAISGVRDGFAAWGVQRLWLNLNLDLGRHRRLLISGGTGFIGSALVAELLRAGHDITLLSRRPRAAALQFAGRVRALRNTRALAAAEVFDVIVNLAGAPVVGLPWSRKRKRELASSRLSSTRDLLDFVMRAQQRPQVWVQASAIGFYGSYSETPLDESAAAGEGFAAELCSNWEAMTAELAALSVRCVVLRFGLVFGRSGGALPMLLLSFRVGAGAILGDGKQRIGWIHLEDLLRLIAAAIRDPSMHGNFNAVAPDSPSYREFAQLAGQLLSRPVWLRLPAALLRRLLGEMASLFVDGPYIVPRRLQAAAFEYRFPNLREALMDLT